MICEYLSAAQYLIPHGHFGRQSPPSEGPSSASKMQMRAVAVPHPLTEAQDRNWNPSRWFNALFIQCLEELNEKLVGTQILQIVS